MNADYLDARERLAAASDRRLAPASVRATKCPYCGAFPHQPCVVLGSERCKRDPKTKRVSRYSLPAQLGRIPAHPARYLAAHVPFLDDPLDLEHLAAALRGEATDATEEETRAHQASPVPSPTAHPTATTQER